MKNPIFQTSTERLACLKERKKTRNIFADITIFSRMDHLKKLRAETFADKKRKHIYFHLNPTSFSGLFDIGEAAMPDLKGRRPGNDVDINVVSTNNK